MFVFDFSLLATSLVWFLNGFKVEQVNRCSPSCGPTAPGRVLVLHLLLDRLRPRPRRHVNPAPLLNLFMYN